MGAYGRLRIAEWLLPWRQLLTPHHTPRVAVAPEAEAAQPAAEDEQPAGHGSGGGDGAKPAKRGFVSSVKAALGKVGKAFKGGKKADKPASKAEL